MANLSEKAIKIVSELNEQLMEAEYKLEAQQRAVSKYRYYLAADANSETVLDLRGAVANLRAYQEQADELRTHLEQALDRVFEITVQGDEPDNEEKTDEELDREFAEQHPRLKEVQALMDKASKVQQEMDMDELERAIAQEISTDGRYRVGHPWHEEMWAEVAQLYSQRAQQLRNIVAERKALQQQWRNDNPEKAAQLDRYIRGEVDAIDYAAIEHKPDLATRASSANVLAALAQGVGNMIVSSADLANSDKTDGFLKKTKAFTRGDFSGAFLQAGVSELAMTALINGIALHGGMIAACGTFFVFSDYMKPAVRLSALMELPVKFIWTHDAFRVGEDGPTHEPVEQEAQIRLMEELKNHSGRNSVLVLRPADSAECTVAWKMAMENTLTPTALILSRQNITDLPSQHGNDYAARYNDALQAQKGAYILYKDENPHMVLVGNGSEVATLVEAANIIKAQQDFKVQIVSIPSIGLFKNQPLEYQNEVIPPHLPTFGLTAGLPSTLHSVVNNGDIFGLDHFGASAPYKILDQKFGFSPQNIASEIQKTLKKRKK